MPRPTLDFRIRQLQCFLTLSDLLNYGRTARALNMSQPTITFQIKSLEEAFGVKLFERDRQQVRLTDAGCTFREYAQSVMNTVDAAQERLGSLNKQLRVRVSCGPVGQLLLLPAVLRALTADYPEFELEVSELTTEQQIAKLIEGTVDALLMVGSLPVNGLRFDTIVHEPLVAIVSRQSALASRQTISVEDLRHTSVIASRLKDCRFQQPFLHELLASSRIAPKIVESPESFSVQLAYAAAGEGVIITTSSMAMCAFPHVVALPFAEPLPEMELGLATMEGNESQSIQIFREVVMACARSTLERGEPASLPAEIHPIMASQPTISVMKRRAVS